MFYIYVHQNILFMWILLAPITKRNSEIKAQQGFTFCFCLGILFFLQNPEYFFPTQGGTQSTFASNSLHGLQRHLGIILQKKAMENWMDFMRFREIRNHGCNLESFANNEPDIIWYHLSILVSLQNFSVNLLSIHLSWKIETWTFDISCFKSILAMNLNFCVGLERAGPPCNRKRIITIVAGALY